jgi:GNAT superfamily N-acetyltransferase
VAVSDDVASTPAVRLATPRDASDVTRLLAEFFSHEGRVVPHLAQNVDAILENPGRGFFAVAGDHGVASTTIRISAGGGASAEIEEVWVQPSARGRGLGGQLLQTAVAECRRRGIRSIELRVTPDDQEVGIPDFYTKQGFRHGGRLIYEFQPE